MADHPSRAERKTPQEAVAEFLAYAPVGASCHAKPYIQYRRTTIVVECDTPSRILEAQTAFSAFVMAAVGSDKVIGVMDFSEEDCEPISIPGMDYPAKRIIRAEIETDGPRTIYSAHLYGENERHLSVCKAGA